MAELPAAACIVKECPRPQSWDALGPMDGVGKVTMRKKSNES